MFPSFKNKADREQKHQDLLAKADRKSRQAYAKRGMYEVTIWASEANKTVTVKTTASSEKDVGTFVQLDPLKKSQEVQPEAEPLPYDAPILEASTSTPAPSPPETLPPEPIDTPVVPTLNLDPSLASAPHAAQQTIKEWFQQYPGLVDLRVNPINLDGSINENYVLGKKGNLYHIRTGKSARPRSIDWNATANAVMDQSLEHIRATTNDAVEAIQQFYAAHPDYATLKIQPIAVNGQPSTKFYLGPGGRLYDLRTDRRAVVSFDSPDPINWLATRIRLEHMYSDGESNSIDELAMMRSNDSSAPSPPPGPPPSPQPTDEESQDQSDSESWVRQWSGDHPDITFRLVDSPSRPDGIDWVATQNSLLDSVAGPGLTSDELFSQLDEEARSRSSTEPDVASMIEEIVEEVAVTQLPARAKPRTRAGLIERGNTLLKRAHSIVAQAKRKRLVGRLRDQLAEVQREPREMAEMLKNDVEAEGLTLPNYKRRRTGESEQDAVVRSSKERIKEIVKNINVRRGHKEQRQLIEEAGVCLQQLRGRVPHVEFSRYYLAIRTAAKRLKSSPDALSSTDRRVRNREETALRMMGEPEPEQSPPEPEQALPNSSPLGRIDDFIVSPPLPEPQHTEQTARSAIRRIVNDRSLVNQLSAADIFIRPVRADGSEISEMILRAPKKTSGNIQFVIPSQSERNKPSYERQVSFVLTLERLSRLAGDKGIDIETGINSHLEGRGLKGAGKSMYQTVERRGKAYNLNDIRGTGLASAFIYQPIGSKYIRVPDLDKNRLNIVYPSRKKLGPLRDISDSVKQMLMDLVYDGKLSQAAYDELSVEDKKLFKEILAATHIQHSFKEKLPDATAAMRAEYDKLRGEMLIGNDNPSIIAQMKSLVVDMYANRLITDKEFKEVISSLI